MNLRRTSALTVALALAGLFTADAMGQGVSGEPDPLRGQGAERSEPARPRADKQAFEGDRPPGSTEITASEAVTFESEESKAVFTGDVVVRDPQFILTAQRLTAYMSDDSGGERKTGNGESPSGGLSKAIAEGNVVIVQIKKAADGETKRYEGRGQKVVYDAKTDEVTLSGTPQVREGINVHLATSPSTVITIKRDGKLVTRGPSKTLISNTKSE